MSLSSSAIEPSVVVIENGTVTQGTPDCPADSKVKHRWTRRNVHVAAFAISTHPVTVEEYLSFSKATGYPIADDLRTDPRFQQNPRQPAVFVSWIDAVRYGQWLTRETGKPYRLPRDAEYERAARGGLDGKLYPWGDEDPKGRCDHGNADGAPLPVGSFAPNGYGLYDMSGSVWSWCEECYESATVSDRAVNIYDDTCLRDIRQNPICRGGSFKTANLDLLRCAYRHEDPTDGRFDCIGFRLAMSLP